MSKKILIFQYSWLLQNYSINLASKLIDLGFEVYFLGFNITKHQLSDLSQFKKRGIFFKEFIDSEKKITSTNKPSIKKYCYTLLWHFYKLRHYFIFNNIKYNKTLNRSVLYQTHRFLKNKNFDYIIGVEKQGLHWAGIFSELFDVKLVYYSLELFVEDMQGHNDWMYYEPLRKPELYYHKRCDATIIQDKLRAVVLEKYNLVKNTRIYLPVAVSGASVKTTSNYFQNKFNINNQSYLLLYFGVIGPYRFCEETVEISKKLPLNISMVFHGIDFSDYVDTKLKSKSQSTGVYFSLDKEPENKIPEIIRSAHIGLALYHLEYLNDRHIAYSSQKIAYYFKCGIPIIAFKNESFIDLYSHFKCVRMINDVSEIPEACSEIIDNYELYSSEAYKAYDKFYRFENISEAITMYFN